MFNVDVDDYPSRIRNPDGGEEAGGGALEQSSLLGAVGEGHDRRVFRKASLAIESIIFTHLLLCLFFAKLYFIFSFITTLD